ncbi:MAG: HD-GYP domain-containing protein [Burkholderiaceae bacterium]|nr:HD-GYP domain-containing protein [Sulfuritalea sp.]MCF8174108.1 HD-GYP domain-containing protein [Burkholderiaceae bacterium]MCF8184149.1 HD-GYP domain-containing protein [Polynucleobacter sp.]
MLKKIGVASLRRGMYVHELCGSWMEHPFWRSKFTLKDADDLRRIRESGISELWIDTGKGLDVISEEAPVKGEAEVEVEVDTTLAKTEIRNPPARTTEKVDIGEEMRKASRICEQGKAAVVSMFQEVRMGQAISTDAAGALVEDISSSVMRNPGALISLARLKTADDYTYMHSVAVCALMVALARQLGLDEASTQELGLAGLLHDLGKALMPMDVLNKPGKLSDEEFAIIKGHPEAGHKILVQGAAVGPIPLEVVLHHHEKMDGSGYPGRLKGEELSLYSRMGAVCDVYDAITSNRPYKNGWGPAESIRKMAEWCNGHFDERIFQAFVKCIGIYPIGSLVRLSSERLAVVIDQSEKSLLMPHVKVFFSTKSKTHISPELIDLSDSLVKEKIVSREDAGAWGLTNIEQFWVP